MKELNDTSLHLLRERLPIFPVMGSRNPRTMMDRNSLPLFSHYDRSLREEFEQVEMAQVVAKMLIPCVDLTVLLEGPHSIKDRAKLEKVMKVVGVDKAAVYEHLEACIPQAYQIGAQVLNNPDAWWTIR